jgi:hypothetical protein
LLYALLPQPDAGQPRLLYGALHLLTATLRILQLPLQGVRAALELGHKLPALIRLSSRRTRRLPQVRHLHCRQCVACMPPMESLATLPLAQTRGSLETSVRSD